MSNIISLFSNNTQVTFQRQEDGYINATALCKNSNKQIGNYLRNQTTTDFLTELEVVTQIRITDLVQIQQGGEPHLQGTWVHPQVAINLAQWLSPKFAVQVSKWVQDWITKKEAPQMQKLPQIDSKFLLQIAQEMAEKERLIELQSEKITVLEIETQEQQEKIEVLQTETNDLRNLIKNQFKGIELFQRRQVANFLKGRGLDIKEYQITEYLSNKGWICKSDKNKEKATAKASIVGQFVNDLIPYTYNGVKKVREYGKFTVDGLIAVVNHFANQKQTSRA